MRFRPEQHLRRPDEIRAVREKGRRLECGAFTLWCRFRESATSSAATSPHAPPRPTLAHARVCVVASTAAVGGAVHRNGAKRRLRELFRRHQAGVPANCDLLVIARHATLRWPFAELEQKFVESCRRLTPPPSHV